MAKTLIIGSSQKTEIKQTHFLKPFILKKPCSSPMRQLKK